MFASTIVINDRVPVAKNFVQTSIEDFGSVRIDNATTALLPRKMAIRHSISGKGADTVDRHLLQFSTVKNDTLNIARTLVTNVTIAVPRSAAIVQTDVDDHIAFLRNWLSVTSNVTGWMIGEY